MTNIILANRTLCFPKKYVDFYEKHVCCSFLEMAEFYLLSETSAPTLLDAISNYSDEELISIIKSWVAAEYEGMGLEYAGP